MKNRTPKNIIYLCTGSKCEKKGGKDCYKKLKRLIKKEGDKETIEVIRTACTDRCERAPVLAIQPANKWMLEYKQDEVLDAALHLIKKG